MLKCMETRLCAEERAGSEPSQEFNKPEPREASRCGTYYGFFLFVFFFLKEHNKIKRVNRAVKGTQSHVRLQNSKKYRNISSRAIKTI